MVYRDGKKGGNRLRADGYTFEDIRLAYIAGLFDGEGSVSVFKAGGQYACLSLRIQIVNTNITPLQLVVNMLKGTIHTYPYTPEQRMPCYRWRIGGVAAGFILEKLLPYLIIKKERAILGIEFVCTTNQIRRLEIFNEMHELNKRGVDTN